MPDDVPPSQPTLTREPAPGRPAAAGPPRRLGSRTMLLLFVLLVFGPALVRGVPSEISRWYAAAAMENREAGEAERAYANLQTALDWDSQQAGHYLARAGWRTEDGKYEEALADANKAIELGGENAASLGARALALQHLGRHAEAIADAKKIDYISQTSGEPERTTALNNLAYARAVGKLELEEGLKDINQAIDLLSPVPAAELVADNPTGKLVRVQLMSMHAGWYDTRGFLQYQLGNYEEALKDLERAVADAATCLKSARDPKIAAQPQLNQGRLIESLEKSLAVLYYHRALAYEKLGRSDDAAKDLARVKELIGREPDEHLF